MFVTLEGIDGAGKSTQAAMLAAALGERAQLLREPGGTEAGERLRELLKDPAVTLEPRAELLLFAAARAQLVEQVIRPALADGRIVVCDRFVDSTLAYQGAGRGLGAELVGAVNDAAIAGCMPDLTVFLRLDPEAAIERLGRRDGATGTATDRFEAEGPGFQARIAAEYERITAAEPERVVALDASADADTVHAAVLELVSAHIEAAA